MRETDLQMMGERDKETETHHCRYIYDVECGKSDVTSQKGKRPNMNKQSNEEGITK